MAFNPPSPTATGRRFAPASNEAKPGATVSDRKLFARPGLIPFWTLSSQLSTLSFFMSPSLPEVLPIQPFTRPVHGQVTLPGSKSLTNRALLLAALCDRPVTLTGALFSEDTHLMVEALKALGFTVNPNADAHT